MEPTAALFGNVPQKDVFHLFENGQVQPERVLHLLDYKKKDVSQATSLPVTSIRYDVKMPDELRQRLTEWATALNLVGSFFGDEHKTILWFGTPNPLLGNTTPRDMIRVGRFRKLLKFIQTALQENVR